MRINLTDPMIIGSYGEYGPLLFKYTYGAYTYLFTNRYVVRRTSSGDTILLDLGTSKVLNSLVLPTTTTPGTNYDIYFCYEGNSYKVYQITTTTGNLITYNTATGEQLKVRSFAFVGTVGGTKRFVTISEDRLILTSDFQTIISSVSNTSFLEISFAEYDNINSMFVGVWIPSVYTSMTGHRYRVYFTQYGNNIELVGHFFKCENTYYFSHAFGGWIQSDNLLLNQDNWVRKTPSGIGSDNFIWIKKGDKGYYYFALYNNTSKTVSLKYTLDFNTFYTVDSGSFSELDGRIYITPSCALKYNKLMYININNKTYAI